NWFLICCCIFFFSSRRRHTRFSRDWSSDVCSSDLERDHRPARAQVAKHAQRQGGERQHDDVGGTDPAQLLVGEMEVALDRLEDRSEERRVGKEGRARGGTED